jgi:tetratricopeptide (TPR) repeat protein
MRSLQRRNIDSLRYWRSGFSHRSENTAEVIEDQFDLYQIGIQYFNEQRYRESQTFFQRVLEKSPAHIESQFCLGVSLSKLLRHADAEPYFRNLVESAPDKEGYRYWRGSNLVNLVRYNEAEPHLQRAVDLKPNDDRGADSTNRDWLNKCQSNLPHRVTVADIFEEALARNSGDSVAFGDLGVTRLYQNRFAEALALFREALRLFPADFYKIQIVECYERLGNTELAQQMRLEYPDLFEVNTPEPDQELLNPPTFTEFLTSGSTWLDGAGWENRQLSPLLKSLHQQNAIWADPAQVLFPDYDIEEDDLAEALARAESLQQHLHLETEMPVYLQTEWVSIAMTIENGWIRAWVGIGLEGCAVSLNPSTWDLQFLNGDRDALFAAAAAVNWYIDCSIILTAHPKFCKESEDRRDDIRPWPSSANGWSATSLFSDDVDDIRKGRQAAPSRAYRVRGHIRSLTQGEPTDDARAKAPAHIRRLMGPNDTWVQAHTRGGETETQNLLNRLHKHSSLADFLATAHLDSD